MTGCSVVICIMKIHCWIDLNTLPHFPEEILSHCKFFYNSGQPEQDSNFLSFINNLYDYPMKIKFSISILFDTDYSIPFQNLIIPINPGV